MISKKQIKAEFDGLMSLKGLVEVYEEVASSRMQKVRTAVLQSRQFLEGLLEVFKRVKAVYLRNPEIMVSNRPRNGKTVAVFVSANSGLYGDIVDRTFDIFADSVKKGNQDIVVLGKLGLKMVNDKLPGRLFNYYDFSDEGVDVDSFQMIMRYLMQFEKILVFYGKFKTILYQEPVVTSVSGDADVAVTDVVVGPEGKKMAKQYLFEPSVEEIAKVFNGEILASIFEQTLHESQLAKFASRMLALDNAEANIEKRLLKIRQNEIILAHKLHSKKQLSTMSGLTLWNRAR
jgi:ATP synthase F1 gamma subunit